jgi:hypothetical protein
LYYNKRGDIDSSYNFSILFEDGEPSGDTLLRRVIYRYEKDSILTGTETYENGEIVEESEVNWKDPFTMVQTRYNMKPRFPWYADETRLDDNYLIKETVTYMLKGERDSTIRRFIYGDDGHIKQENIKLIRGGKEQPTIVVNQAHSHRDKYGIPQVTALFNEGEEKPRRMYHYTLTYYE